MKKERGKKQMQVLKEKEYLYSIPLLLIFLICILYWDQPPLAIK